MAKRILGMLMHSNPVEAGFFDTGNRAWSVEVRGDIVYLADGNDGIYIIQYNLIQ